ncbi:hypothetical protein [Nocardioides sp. 503]|uniref:hypothetical protein n=1 Tax=Nocardioides sp. 503 TaxID=2508326 RepID=UPI0010702CEE|nr:hypothetical protein [Nocardioides sp. 503]
MSRRLMSRALVVLAVSALILPALSTPAVAGKGVAVPSFDKVAKIFPYLAGGSAFEATDKVRQVRKNCKSGKTIKGATKTAVAYSPAPKPIPPGTPYPPSLGLVGAKFASAASAARYLRRTMKTMKCTRPGRGDYKIRTKKFKVAFGDEGRGYTSTAAFPGQTYASQTVLVRRGKFVILVAISSYNGPWPSRKKTVKLAKLAVRTVR